MNNVFILALEPFNLALLKGLPDADQYAFHGLLGYEDVVEPRSKRLDLGALVDKAEQSLTAIGGSVDAIIQYWDFPASAIAPILCNRHRLPGPSLKAVAACEHKYWSRTEQQRTIPEFVPRFCAVDPFAEDPLSQIDLAFPFWIKPIKAHSSYLGFKIRNRADFNAALPVIRANIAHYGEPFDAFLEEVEMPEKIAGIGGHHCIAEAIISAGYQCTLEGYVHRGEVVVYGVVDSIRSGKHRSCFARYQYPSRLPRRVQERMIDAVGRFLRHIDYDGAPFNAEFYWNPRTDAIWILEVNTRISKSHSPLFLMVDGLPHQKVAIDLALGRRPDFPHRQGKFRVAAKFMLRVFEDGLVERVPHEEDICRLKQHMPEAMSRILTEEGERLAHLAYQDSYSFEIAEVFLGADSQRELLAKYKTALGLLPFKFTATNQAA